MNTNLGAVPLSMDILEKANIGLWAFELDEGKEPRMYVDDVMLDLIGLTEQISPEKTYHAWYDHIDKSAYGLVAESVEKMTAGEHAEVQYPWHHPDGRTMIVRCGGVRNPAYTAGVRIEGTHTDVTDVLHFEKDEVAVAALQADALNYIADTDCTLDEFLNYIADRILSLTGCEQVIFRGKEGVRISKNAKGIPDADQKKCRECPFSDFTNDVYKNGIVEMPDYKLGCCGKMPHKDCPVKSGLMHTVHFEGELEGLLTVHYISEKHNFTDSERRIWAMLADMIGLTLARVKSKEAEKELVHRIEIEEQAQKVSAVISAMAEDYDYINAVNLETGVIARYLATEKFFKVESKIDRSLTDRQRLDVFFETIVHPDELERFRRLSSEGNLRKELAKNPVYKFECLTVSPEGKEEYYRFKFAYMPGEPNLRIMGLLNIDEQVRREQKLAIAQQNAKLKDIEQNLKIIEGLASEYTSVYYIDLDTDGLTPYAMNEETETTFGSVFRSGITYSEAYKLYVNKLIYGEDMKMMLKAGSIANIKRELKNKKTFTTQYRSFDNKFSEMKFVKVGSENEEPKSVALGFAEKDAEIRHEQQIEAEQRRNFEIIEVLASEYSSVYYIDLTTDELNPYTMNETTESEFGEIFRSGIKYSEAYRMYVDKRTLPEDKEMMLKAGSIGNIMDELIDRKTFITTFRNADGHYCEMKFVKVGNETGLPTAVALGFADKDAELRAKEEESIILQRNIDIIEILASEYSSVYYIDLTTDELDPYTMSGETESRFGQIFRSGIKYSEAYKMYVDKLVYKDDQEMMLSAGSIYSIIKELRNKKTYITTYRNEDGSWCEMKFVKVGDNRNPTAVALGFANKDEEIKAEMLRKEKAERDMAVISGLSDDFGCVVYTGYDGNSEIHYRFDPVFEEHIPGWSKITDFGERLETLTNTLVHPDDRQLFANSTRPEVVKKALKDKNVYYVNFRLVADGEIIYYQAKFVRDPQHEKNNVIAGFHNVDVETKREMEALEKAETANRAKTDFLFNMSHDIRTPMNAIIGFTNMAIKHKDNPDRLTEYLEKTQSAGELLLTLVNSILDMSRIESGRARLEEDKGDVYLSFANIESTMQELASTKNITLDFMVEGVEDRYVYCDFSRCQRVFINLVSNAIKYTNEGGWVKVSCTQLGKPENGYGLYRYTVEDNGIGMSEEFQKHVFEEFTRENNSTISGIQGTGLGLAVCKSFVTLMSGTIECESKQGVGSKFIVTVPFKLQSGQEFRDPKEYEAKYEHNGEMRNLLEGKVVLLVEDNEMNREIARDILEDEGLVLEEAKDGKSAVKLLHDKGPDFYDFILMDIQMPIMNGYEATREIREMYPNKNIPIIAVSANAFEEDRKASLEAGMNAHIAKPINVRELMDTLKDYICDSKDNKITG